MKYKKFVFNDTIKEHILYSDLPSEGNKFMKVVVKGDFEGRASLVMYTDPDLKNETSLLPDFDGRIDTSFYRDFYGGTPAIKFIPYPPISESTGRLEVILEY